MLLTKWLAVEHHLVSEWSVNIRIECPLGRQECCLLDLFGNLDEVSECCQYEQIDWGIPSYLDTNVKGAEEFEFWKYDPPSSKSIPKDLQGLSL